MIAYLVGARRGGLYTCMLGASRVEGKREGEKRRRMRMRSRGDDDEGNLLNCSQVRDIEPEGEVEAATFDSKGKGKSE